MKRKPGASRKKRPLEEIGRLKRIDRWPGAVAPSAFVLSDALVSHAPFEASADSPY